MGISLFWCKVISNDSINLNGPHLRQYECAKKLQYSAVWLELFERFMALNCNGNTFMPVRSIYAQIGSRK